MKKFMIIFVIMTLLVSFMIMSSESPKFMNIKNDVMPEEFELTLNSSYMEDDESVEINVCSENEQKSLLKTISYYRYIEKQNFDFKKYKETDNEFRYKVEKSLYESKNFMDVYSLDEKSVIEDYYHAAYVGDVLKDEAYMQKLLKVYESGSIKIESELDYIYKEIVEYFLYNHVPSRYTETILEQLSNLVQEKELVIDYEHLNKTKAYIQYLITTHNTQCVNDMKKLLNKYAEEKNQRRAYLKSDIEFEDYIWIMNLLGDYTGNKMNKDFFHSISKKNLFLQKGMEYDITSPLNFACMLTSMAYRKKKVSTIMYQQLVIIYEQVKQSVNKKDIRSLYYLKYAGELLNKPCTLISQGHNKKDYYSNLLHDKKITEKEYGLSDTDVVQILTCADVCEKSENIKKKLKQMDIFSLDGQGEFAQILNLYVIVMQKYNLLTEDTIKQLMTFIESQKGIFGYEQKNAYDFRASVYYVNAKYILTGGKDIGLR